MTDNPVPESAPVPVPESAPVPESVPAKKRPRRIAAVLGASLLAGVVVTGVGYTVVTVVDADREANAPAFTLPKTPADSDDVRKASAAGLAGVLVPYGASGWYQGPDLGEFGHDAVLSDAQSTALRKKSLSGLPRSQRRQLEKQIDKQHIKGMAVRSYLSSAVDPGGDKDGIYSVRVALAQFPSTSTVRNLGRFQQQYLDAQDGLRQGPEVKGHKNAKCFLPPKAEDAYGIEGDADDEYDYRALESMFCTAYQGDVLVTVNATGPAPLDTKGAAMLLSTQLDRIVDPGEAV
ncbi:hypothetical protein [Streptomyces sp. AK08-02]|uniref:hypothetical protein n=1 Tax=Streptomyces sp. AK08-02 TaxID=3028654 RepID=UPI0029BA175E|nr:hypothetical protein [Streptomyces sp. AK08-02]MDX3750760.1 hypothetical protein [Streptomyces sp. AK08-02]